jgi:hypothetical protein
MHITIDTRNIQTSTRLIQFNFYFRGEKIRLSEEVLRDELERKHKQVSNF